MYEKGRLRLEYWVGRKFGMSVSGRAPVYISSLSLSKMDQILFCFEEAVYSFLAQEASSCMRWCILLATIFVLYFQAVASEMPESIEVVPPGSFQHLG